MSSRSDEFRKHVNDLWRQAKDQLDEVRDVVLKSRDRIEADLHRLRGERDKLLIKLGEQTYRLINQGDFPVPAIIKQTAQRLNLVIDRIVKHEKKPRKKRSSGRKKSTKRASPPGSAS